MDSWKQTAERIWVNGALTVQQYDEGYQGFAPWRHDDLCTGPIRKTLDEAKKDAESL